MDLSWWQWYAGSVKNRKLHIPSLGCQQDGRCLLMGTSVTSATNQEIFSRLHFWRFFCLKVNPSSICVKRIFFKNCGKCQLSAKQVHCYSFHKALYFPDKAKCIFETVFSSAFLSFKCMRQKDIVKKVLQVLFYSPDKALYLSDKAPTSRACTSPIGRRLPFQKRQIPLLTTTPPAFPGFPSQWVLCLLVCQHTADEADVQAHSLQHSDYLLPEENWKLRENILIWTWFQKRPEGIFGKLSVGAL